MTVMIMMVLIFMCCSYKMKGGKNNLNGIETFEDYRKK